MNSNFIKFPDNFYKENEKLKNVNHYSKLGEKAEHPSKILIPKHFPLIKKPNLTNKLNINFKVFDDDNFPNGTKNDFQVFKGDKAVRNSFLRSLNHLVKYKQFINSIGHEHQNYLLYGNNFYEEEDENSEKKETGTNMDTLFDSAPGFVNEKKLPFNNQSRNLMPTKFPLHTNLTNSFLASNLTTEQNLIKGNYLNEQVSLGTTNQVPEILKLLSKNGGIHKKLIKKFNT